MGSREARTGAPEAAETTVLVVDDEPDVASMTATYLDRHLDDVAIVVESSASDALERLESSTDGDIDCVVSDYEMPGTDGLGLLRRIRDHDPDLPFILFTARGSEEIASEAISAGVTDYLQKGVGTDQYQVLANRIENAIARRESEAAAAETKTRYQRLLENSPHAVGVHDGEEIIFANDRLAEIMGYEAAADFVGLEHLAHVHEDDRAKLVERATSALDDGISSSWAQWRVCRADGEIRHVESQGGPVSFEGKSAIQFVVRDVTDRRRHERRIRALHDATSQLVTAEEPVEVGEITIETVTEVLDEPIVCLWAFDPAAGKLVSVSASERAKRLAREYDHDPDWLVLPESTVEMSVFEEGEPRAITDYGDRDDIVVDSLEAVLLYPLDRNGLLTIASTDPDRTFEESERDLLGILARSVAAAMDRVGADTGND